ncbi:MAG: 4Fe-4S binding protein [Campylobacterales bacterium]
MALSILYERCVRTRSELIGCEKCIDVCPVDALELVDGSVVAYLQRCVSCALCQASCPTEAIATEFNPLAYLHQAASLDLVACGDDLPCLGALSVEEWVMLGAEHPDGVVVSTSQCQQCAIAEQAKPLFMQTLTEADALLRLLGFAGLTIREDEPSKKKEPDRRSFFRALAPRKLLDEGMRFAKKLEGEESDLLRLDLSRLSYKLMREQLITKRRQVFIEFLAQLPAATEVATPPLSFTSIKEIDPMACDDCGFCYKLCPTGALHASRWHDEIRFQQALCVRCHACHDLCDEHGALLMHEVTTLAGFLRKEPVTLLRQRVKRCIECGAIFKYEGQGDPICPKCVSMDAEARELLGF